MGIPVRRRGEVVSNEIRSRIPIRYKTVTRSINKAFWDMESETLHSLYVGSYGRGAAIDDSDIDILIELPEVEYNRFDAVWGNGQSRLLQAVRSAILESYPRSDVRADGQVVKIAFSNGMKFEILPALKKSPIMGLGMVNIHIQIQIWEETGFRRILRQNKKQCRIKTRAAMDY